MYCIKCGMRIGDDGVCPKCDPEAYLKKNERTDDAGKSSVGEPTVSSGNANGYGAQAAVYGGAGNPYGGANTGYGASNTLYGSVSKPYGTVNGAPPANYPAYPLKKKKKLANCAWFAPVSMLVSAVAVFFGAAFLNGLFDNMVTDIEFKKLYKSFYFAFVEVFSALVIPILICVAFYYIAVARKSRVVRKKNAGTIFIPYFFLMLFIVVLEGLGVIMYFNFTTYTTDPLRVEMDSIPAAVIGLFSAIAVIAFVGLSLAAYFSARSLFKRSELKEEETDSAPGAGAYVPPIQN